MDTRYPGFGYIPVPSLDPTLFSWVLCFPNHLLFFPDKIRYLTMTDSSKVWMPDTFFRNEKIGRFHNILQPNLYVRVFPNGDVLYSIRVSLTCACSMHLALFPLDKQTCNLDVASCKYKHFIITFWPYSLTISPTTYLAYLSYFNYSWIISWFKIALALCTLFP